MKVLESNAAEINGDYILTNADFENMSMKDTYDNYGQSVSPEDAGAAFSITKEQGDTVFSSLTEDHKNEVDLENLKELWDAVTKASDWGDAINAYNDSDLYSFFTVYGGFTDEYSYQVKAYNYWDGNNWQTVTIEDECTDPHYTDLSIDEADEAQKIIDEWEVKEFVEENNGWRYYESANYKFSTSAWQGDWFTAIVDCK